MFRPLCLRLELTEVFKALDMLGPVLLTRTASVCQPSRHWSHHRPVATNQWVRGPWGQKGLATERTLAATDISSPTREENGEGPLEATRPRDRWRAMVLKGCYFRLDSRLALPSVGRAGGCSRGKFVTFALSSARGHRRFSRTSG